MADMKIVQLTSTAERVDEFADLLIQTVEDGASVGFLPPLSQAEATQYWEGAVSPDVILLVALIDNRIAGSIQLHLSSKPNGAHRAEIAKLMTHPAYRRKGVARALMQQAEERAKQEGRTLLVLDTREGDPSNRLYTSLEYIQAGRIPNFSQTANGELHATIFYYKQLS